VTLQTKFNLN